MLDKIGSGAPWEILVESIQPTSIANDLVFFKVVAHVQEAAFKCSQSCKWASGLFDPLCTYLKGMHAIERIPDNASHETQAIAPIASKRNMKKEAASRMNDPTFQNRLTSAISVHSSLHTRN